MIYSVSFSLVLGRFPFETNVKTKRLRPVRRCKWPANDSESKLNLIYKAYCIVKLVPNRLITKKHFSLCVTTRDRLVFQVRLPDSSDRLRIRLGQTIQFVNGMRHFEGIQRTARYVNSPSVKLVHSICELTIQ